jgi:hypothetical protein
MKTGRSTKLPASGRAIATSSFLLTQPAIFMLRRPKGQSIGTETALRATMRLPRLI